MADENRDTSSVESKFARLLAEDVPEDEQFQRAVNDLLDNARLYRYGLQKSIKSYSQGLLIYGSA